MFCFELKNTGTSPDSTNTFSDSTARPRRKPGSVCGILSGNYQHRFHLSSKSSHLFESQDRYSKEISQVLTVYISFIALKFLCHFYTEINLTYVFVSWAGGCPHVLGNLCQSNLWVKPWQLCFPNLIQMNHKLVSMKTNKGRQSSKKSVKCSIQL